MGRLNRAMKRKAEKLAFKEKMNIDNVHEEAVKNLVDDRTRRTTQVLIEAMVLSDMLEWSRKQNKKTRMMATINSVHAYVNKIMSNNLSNEEREVLAMMDQLGQGGR